MKIDRIIYLTAIFSLGINSLTGNFGAKNAIARTNPLNEISRSSSSFTSNSVNLKPSLNNQNLVEQTGFPWQIARQAYRGRASWYGGKFHGRRTASGEIFNSNALTAAHKSLPFGTKVKVTNVNNGRSVVVRINDRGPFVKGRIIDVSAAAARKLRMIDSGTAMVQLEVVRR